MASGLRSFASSDRFVAEIEASRNGGALRPGYVLLGDEMYLYERCRRAVLDELIDPVMRDFSLAEIDLAETSIFEALDRAHAAGGRPTDEAQAIEWLGDVPRLVAGAAANLKITSAADLAIAAALLKEVP